MRPESKISEYTLTWLLAPHDLDTPELADDSGVGRLPYGLPPEIGEAWIESLALSDGIQLFRAVHSMEASAKGQLVTILDVDTSSEAPVFCAQIILYGRSCHYEYWQGRNRSPVEILAGPGLDTFRYHQEWRGSVMVEGGVTSEMRSVIVPNATMIALLGESVAMDLIDQIGLSKKCPTVVRPVPFYVSAPLRECLSGQFSGLVRKLYAQARVLDYLSALLQHFSKDHVTHECPHRKSIHELHDDLLSLEGRVPTLGELAKKYGMSVRRLNEEFAAEYGKSIFNFVTDYRLEQAHISLLIGEMPMKVVAARLGYSHVNHFIAAFKHKFGYTPGSLHKTKSKMISVG
ncbi:MAG: helix-turn-helix transcriptional regulator [Methylotenera sp.]|nr:helix-turn-helix transcriptional regulator [Methylotenera sp.]